MARLTRWTIPGRIVAGFVVVLVAFGAVAALSLVQHHRTARTLELLHQGYLPLALTLGEAKATQSVYGTLLERVTEGRQAVAARAWLKAALNVRPVTLRRAYEGLETAQALAEEIGDPAPLESVRRTLDDISKVYSECEARYTELFALLEEENPQGVEELLSRLRADEQLIQRFYRVGWRSVQEQITATSEAAAKQESRATLIFALLALLALAVGVAVTWWSQRILRPIPLLQRRVQAVARGDLSTALEVKRDDELGQLVREFERMVQALAARDADLREAARAEQRLQKMQVQIVEALNAAVVALDNTGVVQTVNPAAERVLGLSASDVGKEIAQTSLIRRSPVLRDAVQTVAQGGSAVYLEGQLLTGFTERLVDVLVTPFGDGQEGGRRAVLVVADDVTDAVATKSRLIQTERLAAIGRMAAHVTHEVRNPLSSIGLNIDMLTDEFDNPSEEAQHLVHSIRTELDRLESITEEYLRLARLPEPNLQTEDPRVLIEDLANFVAREMSDAHVELNLKFDKNLPPVAIDEPQLRQALLNLLRNAREAMPEGGVAGIEVGRYEDGVRIQVHDEGAGIGDTERSHVFDLFYTTKERGTGLGLPLTQQIVVAHGGHISCRERHPRGTTFDIWLPTVVRETNPGIEPQASSARRVG